MKKLIMVMIMGLYLTNCTIPVVAAVTEPQSQPIADIYKEGIYHFDKGVGNRISLELLTPNKPVTIIIFERETNKMKYYVEFTNESKKIDIYLENPLPQHTTVIVGEGELSYSFK